MSTHEYSGFFQIAWLMQVTMGTSATETLSVAGNIFVSQVGTAATQKTGSRRESDFIQERSHLTCPQAHRRKATAQGCFLSCLCHPNPDVVSLAPPSLPTRLKRLQAKWETEAREL